jgi:hypothetical protein
MTLQTEGAPTYLYQKVEIDNCDDCIKCKRTAKFLSRNIKRKNINVLNFSLKVIQFIDTNEVFKIVLPSMQNTI